MFLGQGYVFTGVSDSVNRGGVPHPPGADTPLGADPPGADPPGANPHQRACCEIRSMRGRYASYWNTILLYFHVVSFSWILLEPLLFTVRNEVAKGYVFTRVCQSFCLRGVCYPSMHCRWYPSMPCSGGVLSKHALQVVSQHTLQWGVLSQHALQVVSQHALQQGGGLLLGGACSRGVWRPPPKADGYCCGRYASYWNAFLLNISHALCLQPVLLIVMVLPIHLKIQTVLIHKSNSSRVIK